MAKELELHINDVNIEEQLMKIINSNNSYSSKLELLIQICEECKETPF